MIDYLLPLILQGTIVNFLSTLIAAAIGVALVIAFYRATRHAIGTTRHYALAICWITGAYILRGLYWDVIRALTPPEMWATWTDMTHGLTVNILFGFMFTFGAFHGLWGLHLTIPIEDREQWPWWRAWLYPPWSPADPFRALKTNVRANLRLRRRRRDIDRK